MSCAPEKEEYVNPATSQHCRGSESYDQEGTSNKLAEYTLCDLINEMKNFGSIVQNLKAELSLFREEFKDMRTDLNDVYSEFLTCKDDVTKLSHRTAEVERRLDLLETTVSNEGIRSLQESIEELKHESNEREQHNLLTDIELVGIPEASSEDLRSLVKVVATKLEIPLHNADIVSIHRIGPTQATSGAAASECAETSAPRPRHVVMRCAQRALRDQILTAARVHSVTTADFGMCDTKPKRIYFNERLTRRNKKLLQKVKEEKKRRNWKFVWVKDGNILVKRGPGEKVFRISRERDITNVLI